MSAIADRTASQPRSGDGLDDHVRAVRPERTRARPEDREMIASAQAALALLDSKWAVDLVFLMASGIRRHARLFDNVPGISKKMLTRSLRALERNGLVERRVFADTPVRVEYALTPLGWKLTELLMAVYEWATEHAEELANAEAGQPDGEGAVLALPVYATPSLAAA